jgi:hypothetical protein
LLAVADEEVARLYITVLAVAVLWRYYLSVLAVADVVAV